ncbi:hypothetical protein PAECIP112173_01969 [Paenibacillus sp. JJ-100]|nr:hypothetical protein PAECIP112173_01969 [Paenibacillus sp. JJ-100]
MEINSKLNRIRTMSNVSNGRKVYALVWMIILGGIMGLAAKLVDTQGVNPVFDQIGGRLGIWIFVATLISVYSYSPRSAAVKVFSFFTSLLTFYYLYTVFFLHFFSKNETMFWVICAVVSPICAVVMWYARGHGYVASFILSLPVAVLITEGYTLKNAYLPEHEHYYLVPILMGFYLLMVITLLWIVPRKKIHMLTVIPVALLLSFIMIYFDIIGKIFGGLNGFL